jgi:hypothetical protein
VDAVNTTVTRLTDAIERLAVQHHAASAAAHHLVYERRLREALGLDP